MKYNYQQNLQFCPINQLQLIRSVKLSSTPICMVALSNRILIGDRAGNVVDYPSHKKYAMHKSAIFTIKHINNSIMTGSADFTYSLLDLDKQSISRKKQNAHENSIKVINTHDNVIFTGGRDGKIKLWDNFKKINEIKLSSEEGQSVSGIQILQHYLLATQTNDKRISVFDLRKSNEPVLKLEQQLCRLNMLRSKYDNRFEDIDFRLEQWFESKNIMRMHRVQDILIINSNSYVSIYDIHSLDTKLDQTHHGFEFGHHSRIGYGFGSLLAGELNGNLNLVSKNKYQLQRAHDTQINELAAIDSADAIIASLGDDNYIKLWNY